MSRTNGEKSSFRGTLREKFCVGCGVEPNGAAYARSYKPGQMNSAILLKYMDYIDRGSTVTTDNNNTYGILEKEHQVKWNICYNCKDYKADVNFNAVNSFHSMIKSYHKNHRGMASKYLNRYCNMLSLKRNLLRINTSEYIDEKLES